MTEKSQPKRKRGGQKGNQNARTHGRYSLVCSPREKEVLKAVAALDLHGQCLVLKYLVTAGDPVLFESHSFRPVPEKAEPIPENPDLGIDLDAWAREQNIDLDKFMSEVCKTIPGWDENE